MNQNNFDAEGMLKGRMAETLVDDLLKQSGNKVYRFGYEAILQNLTQIQENFDGNTDAGERIRTIPDFIIINKEGNPIFLEVKFRWDGKPHQEDKDREKFERIEKLWKAKIIIVNKKEKPYFRVVDIPYINEEGLFNWKPLIDEDCWEINKDVYDKFESLIDKYMNPVIFPVKK